MLLAIKFRTTPDRVFARIPLNRRGVVQAGPAPFNPYPGTSSEQCPGCGSDIAEEWTITAENPGVAVPELGEAFAAECRAANCGHRMTGTVVEMPR